MIQRRKSADSAGRKRAVIFDFDGTIADSLPAIVSTVEDLIGRTQPFTDEEIAALRDLPVPELLKQLGVPAWKLPILLFRGRRMLRAHMHGIAVHEGMAAILERLHEQEIPLYVLSSNSTENVQKYLQWHKLSHCFAGVYGGVGVLGKASRLRTLIKNEQLHAEASWSVGDEMRDIAAARAVGLNVAAVAWGYNTHEALAAKEPNAVVDTAKDLLRVLEASWKK